MSKFNIGNIRDRNFSYKVTFIVNKDLEVNVNAKFKIDFMRVFLG